MVFWVINKSRDDFEPVRDIARAQLSQQKFVHILGPFVAPISVDITDSSERGATLCYR